MLRLYSRHASHDTFSALVARHLGLVHAAALRQLRSPDLARDVAQLRNQADSRFQRLIQAALRKFAKQNDDDAFPAAIAAAHLVQPAEPIGRA